MSRWFETACENLEQELEEGSITNAEYKRAMAELRQELQEEYHERCEEARQDVYGDW